MLKSLDGEDAVIDSIRTPGEVEALRQRSDFTLIEVVSDMEARWQRSLKRARSGDPLDRVTFERQEKAEATAKDDAGQALNATAELADITLNNSGSIDELNKNLDELFIILNQT